MTKEAPATAMAVSHAVTTGGHHALRGVRVHGKRRELVDRIPELERRTRVHFTAVSRSNRRGCPKAASASEELAQDVGQDPAVSEVGR
ncbi:MAG: hypothetical protein ABI899_00715, partial [Actinomycetota bacterium]